MEATFGHTSRGGFNLFLVGHIYRYQKSLAGDLSRWKCDSSGRNSRCSGFAVTRGKGPGCDVVNLGPHGANCDPGDSRKDSSAIRQAVIQAASGTSGVTPTRAVAEHLAGLGKA